MAEKPFSPLTEAQIVKIKRRDIAIIEPKIYLSTTSAGLSFELPVECTARFIKLLTDSLKPQRVEIYFNDDEEHREVSLSADEISGFWEAHPGLLTEGWFMMELDDNTLVSGGGGCFSLELTGNAGDLRREIAEETLQICGFEHRFTSEEFSAIVWEDKLEVKE